MLRKIEVISSGKKEKDADEKDADKGKDEEDL